MREGGIERERERERVRGRVVRERGVGRGARALRWK